MNPLSSVVCMLYFLYKTHILSDPKMYYGRFQNDCMHIVKVAGSESRTRIFSCDVQANTKQGINIRIC